MKIELSQKIEMDASLGEAWLTGSSQYKCTDGLHSYLLTEDKNIF